MHPMIKITSRCCMHGQRRRGALMEDPAAKQGRSLSRDSQAAFFLFPSASQFEDLSR